ncbi:MAG: alpha/beta fold hydrolase [Armatimonadetes bacterium]|nr:alpha/beta fold hydrolase [Armatimonadota bacterium]
MKTRRPWILSWLVWGLVFASCAQTQNSAPVYDPDLIFGYDKNLPLMAQESVVEETSQYTVYKVVYRSARDQKVPAFLILPKNRPENEKLPCVILMHGLGGDKRMFQMMWGMLTQAGFALFAIDAQYHGERKPEDNSPFFGMYPYRTRDALIQTVIDLRRAIDYLETRKEIDPQRIGYIGASMGGILGAIFAGVDSRVQAPILLVAGGDWKILMEKSTLSLWRETSKTNPELVKEALKVMDVVDPVRWVGRISPRPVLMINGDADHIVPVESNKALHEAAREPKTVVWYKGGHVPPPDQMPSVFLQITQWLNQHLKGQKQSALWWRDYLPRFQSWGDAARWLRENRHLITAFVEAFRASLSRFAQSFAR